MTDGAKDLEAASTVTGVVDPPDLDTLVVHVAARARGGRLTARRRNLPRTRLEPKRSRGTRAGRGSARVPVPPKRLPRPAPPPLPPLSSGRMLLRSSMTVLAAVIFGFLLNLTVFSQVQELSSQQQLRSLFAEQLAAGTAPVSEGTFDNVLLQDGEPVARIEIPAIGVDQIVVEGTDAGTLTRGPGHRRDTRLPGQSGVSVLMGRAAAYGGPFGRIQELSPGESFKVVTGQGEHLYRVIGVRYAGDPSPAPPTTAQGRLILESARGVPFMPSGVVRVDAELVSVVMPAGDRQTTFRSLAPEQKELASDLRTVWALVFALQFLAITEAAAVWAHRRFGGAKTWLVFAPVLLLAVVLVSDRVTRLLPNLM